MFSVRLLTGLPFLFSVILLLRATTHVPSCSLPPSPALNLARIVHRVADGNDLINVLRCFICESCRHHGVMCMWPERVNEARLRLWHVWCLRCNCSTGIREALACCRQEIEILQPTWRNVAITDYTSPPNPWSDGLEKRKHTQVR